MEYNKNRFQKTNDKKVLHKVKKQWIVLSMSLLAAIGGGALASHVTTHADTTNNNNQTHVQASTLKGRLNQNLIQSRQFNQQNQARTPKTSNQAIANQANVLHNRIVNNTVNNHLSQNQVKKDVNSNQGNVLKNRIDSPMFGDAGSSVNFVDNEIKNDSDQPSVISSSSVSAGTTYNDLKVPNGYALDALSVGTSMGTVVSNNASIEISPQASSLTANNIPYEVDFKNSNGSAQQTYNAGSASSASSYGNDQKGWTADAGKSSVISAGNAADFMNITLPSGYKMSGSNYTATMTPTGIQWTDANGNVVFSPKFTAVPNVSASTITVHLIDHSGYQVSMTASNGITAPNGVSASISNGDLVFSGAGDFGDTIDVLQSAINSSGNLPSGYSLAPNQYSDYTFGSAAQTVNAIVNTPSASTASVGINVINYNHENSSSSASQSYNLQSLVNSGKASVNDSSVHEGDIVTLNPAAFASSGYNAYQSDYTKSDDERIYVGSNGNLYQAPLDSAGGATPNSGVNNPITLKYSESDTHASDADLPKVTVTYVDQNGKKIVTNSSANIQPSDYGKTIDLTQPSDGGVGVPKGYQLNYSLDDNDATKFTVDRNGNFNETFYVIGRNVKTNDTTDNDSKGNKLNDETYSQYNLPITIKTEPSDSSNSINVKTEGTVYKPNIKGRVGDSIIISPSDALDSGSLKSVDSSLTSSNYGVDPSNKQYRITFEANGDLKVGQINSADPDNSGSDTHVQNITSGSTNSAFSFLYAGNSKGGNTPKKTYSIKVNYLFKDMDYANRSTPKPQWVQIPNTTSSDHITVGGTYNDTAITKNIPKGYQYARILNVDPSNVNVSDDNGVINGDANADPQSNPVVPTTNIQGNHTIDIAVVPTAGNITVRYYNQNGDPLTSDGKKATTDTAAEDVIDGNGNSPYTANGGDYSRYGHYLDITGGKELTDTTKDSKGKNENFNLWNVPKGYHLVQSPTINNPLNGYQFTRQPQTIKLTVVGNDVTQDSAKNKVTVTVNKKAGNGQSDKGNVSNVAYAHGRIGNKSWLDPNDYAPAGYHATPSDNPFEVDFTPNGQAQHGGKNIGSSVTPSKGVTSQNEPDWNYVANTPSQNAFYVNVDYYNEANGKSVINKPERVNGYYGENISDVTEYASYPSDAYQVDKSKNGGQKYSFKLGYGAANQNGGLIRIPVISNSTADSKVGNLKFTVYCVYKAKNGQERISDTTKTLKKWDKGAQSTKVGNTFTVKPSDYNPQPSQYKVDPASVPETVQVVPNGNGIGLSTDQAVFYYDTDTSSSNDKAAPIVIHYINSKNGHQVGTNDVINGKYDNNPISIINGNINNATDADANWSVPDGYTSNYSKSVRFGSDINNVYVPVNPDSVSNTVTLDEIKEDSSDTQLGKAISNQVTLNGYVGQSWTISPYNYVPKSDNYSKNGYHADNDDDDAVVTLGTNGHILVNGIDHDNGNHSYGISYVYRPNSVNGQSDTLDTIRIQYINKDNGQVINSDTEYDHGTTGKKFDISPYTNDIPSNVDNNTYYYYDSTDTNAANNPTAFKATNSTINGQPNNQDVKIFVKPVSDLKGNNDSSNTSGGPANGPTNQY